MDMRVESECVEVVSIEPPSDSGPCHHKPHFVQTFRVACRALGTLHPPLHLSLGSTRWMNTARDAAIMSQIASKVCHPPNQAVCACSAWSCDHTNSLSSTPMG